MDCIYSFEAKKTQQVFAIKKIKPKTKIFSSFFGPDGSSAPQQAPYPPPSQRISDETENLKVDKSSVKLTIFAADVDVELDSKLKAEIHRSTKKDPPHALKYELIYVCVALNMLPKMLTYLSDGEGRV